MSDESRKDVQIDGPDPGNWFVIAFKNWTDPNNDRIEQQGLTKSCSTKLKADLYIIRANPIELLPGLAYDELINEKLRRNVYYVFIPEGVDNANLSINILKSTGKLELLNVFVKPRSLPSLKAHSHKFQIQPSENNESNFTFDVNKNVWHYIIVESDSQKANFEVEYSLVVNFGVVDNFSTENEYGYEITRFRNIEFFNTFRENHRDFFLFDIDVMDKNGTTPEYYNFTSGVNYGFQFNIFDTQDIGGMLTTLVGLINLKEPLSRKEKQEKLPESSEIIYDQSSIPSAEKLIDVFSEPESNTTVEKIAIICLHLNEPGIPEWPGICRYGNTSLDAATIVTSSNRSQSISVPFPEAGEWFLTMKLFCAAKPKGIEAVDIRKLPLLEEGNECNGTIVVGIGSVPCEFNQCGRYGSCYHYMSGGFVYTTCVCRNGYMGWDCTDDSNVLSLGIVLLSTLLLTLSNLLFIPSVLIAFRRKYYTEALIYFFTMFFSSFYHACDSGEDIYSFCLVRLGVLQFCDFYCGLLAIWVTLIAMANLPSQHVQIAHMLGAILLAFGTEYDKQSLTVFLAPALTGLCIISVCWVYRCRKSKKLYPSKKYLIIFLPLGGILVMLGLVCYAFLQTKQNYYIIHSVWHMVMAISILLLLPNKNTFLPK